VIGEWRSPLNGDAAWILFSAGRMLHGARLYADIVEINPPLVFWLNLPVAALAELGGWSAIAVLRVAVITLGLLSLGLTARLLPGALGDGERDTAGLVVLVTLSLALFALPAGYFGQREHLMLALLTPYIVGAAAECGGAPPSRREGLMSGGLAALGLALKPHALPAWAGLVLLGRWRAGRGYRVLSPANVAIVAGLALYLVAVAVLAPGYLSVVRALGPAYQHFSAKPVMTILTRDTLPLSVLAALLVYGACRQAVSRRMLTDHLAVATGGFLLAVVLQGKGFGYHYLTAIGTACLLMALTLAEARRGALVLRASAVVCSTLVLAGAMWPFLVSSARRARGVLSPIDAAMVSAARELRSRAPGMTVAVLSPRLADAFPLMVYARARWGLRLPHLWCLEPEAQTAGVAAWCAATVGEDLERSRPALLLIRRWEPDGPADLRYDFMARLRQDPRAARELERYEVVDSVGPFSVLDRRPAVNQAIGPLALGQVSVRDRLSYQPPGR
jgi:hypothetical protein